MVAFYDIIVEGVERPPELFILLQITQSRCRQGRGMAFVRTWIHVSARRPMARARARDGCDKNGQSGANEAEPQRQFRCSYRRQEGHAQDLDSGSGRSFSTLSDCASGEMNYIGVIS